MKEKSNYITPLLRPVTLRQPLLETVSGSNMGGGEGWGSGKAKMNRLLLDYEDEYETEIITDDIFKN